MSITNEQDNSWTSPVMGDFQNIPRTMFSILFKNLAKRNFYCIMDLNDIKELCDYAYFMKDGEIIYQDSVINLFIQKENEDVVDFISSK